MTPCHALLMENNDTGELCFIGHEEGKNYLSAADFLRRPDLSSRDPEHAALVTREFLLTRGFAFNPKETDMTEMEKGRQIYLAAKNMEKDYFGTQYSVDLITNLKKGISPSSDEKTVLNWEVAGLFDNSFFSVFAYS
jgi:hypothetical protein